MNLYPLGKFLTYILVRVLFRMRYEGLENIPQQGFILAGNHRSNFDPLFIAHKIPCPLCFFAKAELFRNRFIAAILRSVGAFPVERGKGDTTAIDTAAAMIRSGKALTIFPEGTRSRDGKPQRARSGISLIAAKTGADILPCAVYYGERLHFRTTVTVRYGKLIPNEELELSLTSPSTLRGGAKRVMGDIVALLDAGAAER